jgi:phenylpropionate dioxygenase-like ring-hydroxylating dioxygenase large terminal subunit
MEARIPEDRDMTETETETMGMGTMAVGTRASRSTANEPAGTSTLPVISWDWYRDPRVLEAEERRLFRSSWQYVGPLERLRNAGDHVVGRVSRVPVVVVRGSAGELRALLNVCRHRGSLVVPADGNASRLQCPYHAWTYDLDGTLRSAPRCGPEISAELAELGLVRLRVATFGPFVFVNLSADGPPLDDVVGDLSAVITEVGVDLDGLRLRQRYDYEVPSNWKIHLENYLECYHCPTAHPGFSSVMEVMPGRYDLTASAHRLSHRAPVRAMARSAPYSAAGTVTAGSYHLLLPNVKININPGRQNLSIGPVYPEGVDRTVGWLDYYFGADADEAWIDSMMAFDGDVGREDSALVASAQLGVAGSWIDRGRLLPQEQLLSSFQRHVFEACAGDVPDLASG